MDIRSNIFAGKQLEDGHRIAGKHNFPESKDEASYREKEVDAWYKFVGGAYKKEWYVWLSVVIGYVMCIIRIRWGVCVNWIDVY